MTILDKVYDQFAHLEENYSKSKQTRSEFVKEKFGGDIATGSVIILDAIHAEGLDEDPAYIEKASFIKDIFAKLVSCADNIDQLGSFNIEDLSTFDRLMLVLQKAYSSGTKQEVVSQKSMWASKEKVLHYTSGANGIAYCPADNCSVFRAYNESMIALMTSAFHPDSQVTLDEFYLRKAGDRLHRIMQPAVAKNLV